LILHCFQNDVTENRKEYFLYFQRESVSAGRIRVTPFLISNWGLRPERTNRAAEKAAGGFRKRLGMNIEALQAALEEHADYRAWKPSLELYRNLYSGGAQMKSQASNYLYQRHKEPPDVYSERISRAYYENYVGSIIDWYASTLFRREPILTVEDTSERATSWYYGFFQNCDRNHTSITDFLRRRFIEALVYGRSYCGLEFPRAAQNFQTRLEEEQAGADKAYLTEIHPLDVVNWSRGEGGKLEFVTIRLSVKPHEPKRFLVYSTTDYYIAERLEDGAVRVEEYGPHAAAKLRRVPVFEYFNSDGLWLMNKAGHLQLEHFNKSNGLAWSLGTALYSAPVIYSRRGFDQVLGESYYIHLDPEDRFGWSEPEGNVYRIAMENLQRLQEEIYRTCFLMGQSRSWLSSGAAASAQSKRQDYQITQEVLRAYGDGIKDFLKRLLEALAAIREDQSRISVSGLDEFEVGEFRDELDEAEKLFGLGLKSRTFRKQVFKKLALKYLADVNETTKEHIAREIDVSVDDGETE
jgi:hypothetical protein